jgi:TrmH family RNA methyltransferase
MGKKEGLEYGVILVEPMIEGNVGAVARAMANFGVTKLRLVTPCEIGDDGEKRAVHALPILQAAPHFKDLPSALDGFDLSVGTSGQFTDNDKRFPRISLTPRELTAKLGEVHGKVALVFGRENWGLNNEELALLDFLVTIPTSERYPIMNLSHAVAVLLYELAVADKGLPKPRMASGKDKEALVQRFTELMEEGDFPEHKHEKTTIMFRRLLGRAVPSGWEYHRMMGVFGRALVKLKKESERDRK